MLKGNVGEWSEIYVLLKLLGEGKLFAADENLNRIENQFFPITKILREEEKGKIKEYFPNKESNVEIYINGVKQKKFPMSIFNMESELLFEKIKSHKKTKGTFTVEKTEKFMTEIECFKIKASSTDKSDIKIEIVDIHTGYSPIVGFSIKSKLGSAPTLLNAGKTTNFIYKILCSEMEIFEEINEIYNSKGHTDVRGRIKHILNNNGKIEYYNMENKIFKDNLILVDSLMDNIIAETLLYFYRDGIVECKEMIKKLEEENPFKYGNINAYSYKFKKFLTSVALRMRPATEWQGIDEASGGYIIVTKQGDVVAYHIYNRNYFEEYLLNNTKYEIPSTSRHNFGSIYEVNGGKYINLNLQVRFL